LIPVLDYFERVVSVSVNLPGGEPKYWHLPFPRQRWLYGLHLPPAADRPLVVVEGQYDAIQLRRLGWPAYAVLGSKLSHYHAAHLCYLAPRRRVLVYPDNDNRDLIGQAAQVLRGVGLTALAPPSPYMPWDAPKADPDDLARSDPERLLDQLNAAAPVVFREPQRKRRDESGRSRSVSGGGRPRARRRF
jgi:hypothetical protein